MCRVALSFFFLASLISQPVLAEAPADCTATVELSEHLDAIESAVIDDELNEARERVTVALDSLSCLGEVVDAQSLSGVWQSSAAIEYFGASEAAAIRDMGRAKAIPGAEFRARLGEDFHHFWNTAQPELNSELEVHPIPGTHRLFVDGVLRGEPILPLPSGPHVVQVLEGDVLEFHQVVHLNFNQRAHVDTGLEGRMSTKSAGLSWRPVMLWSGVASGGLAVGSYGLALVKDREMYSAKTKEEVVLLRDSSLQYQKASWVFAALAASGIGLHGFF